MYSMRAVASATSGSVWRPTNLGSCIFSLRTRIGIISKVSRFSRPLTFRDLKSLFMARKASAKIWNRFFVANLIATTSRCRWVSCRTCSGPATPAPQSSRRRSGRSGVGPGEAGEQPVLQRLLEQDEEDQQADGGDEQTEARLRPPHLLPCREHAVSVLRPADRQARRPATCSSKRRRPTGGSPAVARSCGGRVR